MNQYYEDYKNVMNFIIDNLEEFVFHLIYSSLPLSTSHTHTD
jgi:hypothetical protein